MAQQQPTIAARRVRWTCRQCGDQVEAEAQGDAIEVECPACGTPRRLTDAGTPAPPTSRSAARATTASVQTARRFRSVRCGCGEVVVVPMETWRLMVAWLFVLCTFPLGLLILLLPIREVRCPGCGGRVSAGLVR